MRLISIGVQSKERESCTLSDYPHEKVDFLFLYLEARQLNDIKLTIIHFSEVKTLIFPQ